MSEDLDAETEKLHEAIHKELEREGTTFLRCVALTTAAGETRKAQRFIQTPYEETRLHLLNAAIVEIEEV